MIGLPKSVKNNPRSLMAEKDARIDEFEGFIFSSACQIVYNAFASRHELFSWRSRAPNPNGHLFLAS
ncbi:MAG TPA: hypothetical protein DD435_07860 [Cyanobacteria bacterium UBA8530]|nr:hypothetical protein [Cyanobacteria bacterium UBA8530]